MRRLNFPGAQQTCYSDWAKTIIDNYGVDITFKQNGEDIVGVYNNHKKIAEYNFKEGTAFVDLHADNKRVELEKDYEIKKFDIDKLLEK